MTGPAAAPSPFRLREGGLATLLLIVAALAMALMARADTIFHAPQHLLYLITAALYALSSPGPLLRHWDLPGQLLFWNATGWALGLALFGLASVGALPILPLILALVGYTSWPRTPETSLPPGAVAIVLIGGLAVCWLAWGDVEFALPPGWE